ncbi:unnamed protein product, partial [Amoebophrya sp. A120]
SRTAAAANKVLIDYDTRVSQIGTMLDAEKHQTADHLDGDQVEVRGTRPPAPLKLLTQFTRATPNTNFHASCETSLEEPIGKANDETTTTNNYVAVAAVDDVIVDSYKNVVPEVARAQLLQDAATPDESRAKDLVQSCSRAARKFDPVEPPAEIISEEFYSPGVKRPSLDAGLGSP